MVKEEKFQQGSKELEVEHVVVTNEYDKSVID